MVVLVHKMWNERIIGVENKQTRMKRDSTKRIKKYYIERFTVRKEQRKQQQAKYIQIDGQLTTMSRGDTVCTWGSMMTETGMHRWFGLATFLSCFFSNN